MAVLELGRRLWADDRNVTTRDFGAFGETLALEIGTEPDRRHEIETGSQSKPWGYTKGRKYRPVSRRCLAFRAGAVRAVVPAHHKRSATHPEGKAAPPSLGRIGRDLALSQGSKRHAERNIKFYFIH